MPRSILLLSGSYVYGSSFLEPYEEAIINFTVGITKMLFVPYASDRSNWDDYTAKVRDKFLPWGIEVSGIHESSVNNSLEGFKAIFIGGGNTFRLLYTLQQFQLLKQINEAVNKKNMRYLGSSAGSNMACPTICTTNDMPIIYPALGFEGLNLVSFQINPHYIDPDSNSKHMGETREDRIREFHEANQTPVVGLREGSFLRINEEYFTSGLLELGGIYGAKFFFPGKVAFNITTATSLILHHEKLIEITK